MKTINCDAVIVGCGVGGLYTALNLPKDMKIIMLSKEDVESCDSMLAQGGICVLRDENDYDSYYEIAFLLNELDKKEESIQMLNTLVNKKPDYYKASELLGSLLCEKEMFKEAINVYQNAIQYDPNNYEIYYNLGIAYTRLNDFQKAQEYYKMAAEINAELYLAMYNLGMLSLMFGDIEEAKTYFEKSVDGEFVEAKGYFNLARIAFR